MLRAIDLLIVLTKNPEKGCVAILPSGDRVYPSFAYRVKDGKLFVGIKNIRTVSSIELANDIISKIYGISIAFPGGLQLMLGDSCEASSVRIVGTEVVIFS